MHVIVLTCYVCCLGSRSHYVVVVVFFLDVNKCHSVSELLSERAGRVRVIMEGGIEIYVIVFEQQGTEVSTGAIYNSHMSSRVGHVRGS